MTTNTEVLIEPRIHNFIENQFPRFYMEEGPVFVAFVTEYYKWMEDTDNTLYHTRRIYDYKDVDETTDEFLVYFKEKYLKKIQLTTETNTRQLIKHSLDLYRSKGTERGIDLLFRAIFGVESEVYFPGDDIFRLSAAKWVVPRYLEVSIHEANPELINKQIVGVTSGATAFVEQVVRRTIKGRFIDLLYISAINGDFETGEKIDTSDLLFGVDNQVHVTGSLTNVLVAEAGVGEDYEVGDIIPIRSVSGEQGQARVVSISNITGLVSFELVDGGYGYSANAEVLVSEKVLTLANVQPNTASNTYFYLFEKVYQPLANINYRNASANLTAGDLIFTYYANNEPKGTGYVLSSAPNTATNGEIFVSVYTGNLQADVFFTTGNAISANQAVSNGYYDRTATGNCIGRHANVDLTCITISGTFERGEEVVLVTAANVFISNGLFYVLFDSIASNGSIRVTNCNHQHIFQPNNKLIGLTSNATANVQSVSVEVGVIDVTNTFYSLTGNYLYGNSSGGNATISDIGLGSGATFGIGSLLYTETVEFNDDYISDYLSTLLADGTYNFPAAPDANLTFRTLDEAFNIAEVEIGSIALLNAVNRGSSYNKAPVVRVYEPFTYRFQIQNSDLYIEGASGLFAEGELITQEATGARGLMIEANSSVMFLKRLRLVNNFIVTTNSTTTIVGTNTATTANIVSIGSNTLSEYMGINAIIEDTVQTGEGAITELQVVDSGFGFLDGEDVEVGEEGANNLVTARGELGTQGHSLGFWKNRQGFLSDQKKLFDGLYYQEYSYEIRTSLSLHKYIDMLKQVMHVAGTKAFGAFVHKAIVNTNISILNASVVLGTTDVGELDYSDINNSGYLSIL